MGGSPPRLFNRCPLLSDLTIVGEISTMWRKVSNLWRKFPFKWRRHVDSPYKSRGPPEVGRVQGAVYFLGLLPSASLTPPIQLSKYPNDDGKQDHQNDRYDYTDG